MSEKQNNQLIKNQNTNNNRSINQISWNGIWFITLLIATRSQSPLQLLFASGVKCEAVGGQGGGNHIRNEVPTIYSIKFNQIKNKVITIYLIEPLGDLSNRHERRVNERLCEVAFYFIKT